MHEIGSGCVVQSTLFHCSCNLHQRKDVELAVKVLGEGRIEIEYDLGMPIRFLGDRYALEDASGVLLRFRKAGKEILHTAN
jgi:hypothetical protein